MNEFIEKLIKELEEAKDRANRHYNYGDETAYRHSIEIVKDLAEEYNDGWIPCSERLPDDFISFEYLTIRKGHTLATISFYCEANKKWYLSRNSTREIEVIAWQPLPNPYREKGEKE